MSTDGDLTRRAFAAWFRTGGTDQPDAGSGVVEHQGRRYVVLRNVNGVLAVYRVRHDEVLRRMRRPPKTIAEEAAS
jgi:hypothetical protein